MKKFEPLNLTNLLYFCDSVRLGSISSAAKANFVTQSTISQAIGKLEKHLGVPLIAHHPNRFHLTPQGTFAFKEGQALLHNSRNLKERLQSDQMSQMGSLTFSSSYSFAMTFISPFLKQFHQNYPTVEIQFSTGTFQEITQRVKLGLVDFGILPDDGDLTDFQTMNVCKGSFNTFVANSISRKEEKKLPFILPARDRPELKFFKESYKKRYKKEPEVLLELNSWATLAKFTAEGLGIGYFPDYMAKGKDLDLRPAEIKVDRISYAMKAAFPKGMQLRKSSEVFLSYFLESK